MTKQIVKKSVYALLLAVAVASPFGAHQVSADEMPATNTTTVTSTMVETAKEKAQAAAKAKSEVAAKEREAAKEAAKVKAEAKLAENKQRVCTQKQARLQSRLDKIATQGTNQLAVFEKISTRVQDFKATKNLTVAEYDTLVAKVTTAHEDATKAVAEATKAPTFDCTKLATAKTGVEAYKKAVEVRNQELKNYKTAVKALLVAVKKSQSPSDDDKVTTTPTNTTTTTTGGTN